MNMRLDEAFPLTPDERERIARSPLVHSRAEHWRAFAAGVHEQVVLAFRDGEITFERMMRSMRSCSLGCDVKDRVTLLALTAERALEFTAPSLRRQQGNPLWVRQAAASLVQMLREDRPGEALVPNEGNGYSTPLLSDAVQWLKALDICDHLPNIRTLHRWYVEYGPKAK